MAVLENIRTKGGIIVSVVIGLALLAFILSDFIGPKNQTRDLNIAEVGGETITYPEYEQKIKEMTDIYQMNSGQSAVDENTSTMIREQAWQQLINEIVMNEEYEDVGLTVTADELFDMIQGANPHAIIRQMFTDRQTGEFSRAQLIAFLKNKNTNEQQQAFWGYIEKELLNERYIQKYNGLVSKGIYAPAFMVKNENTELQQKVDFDFVVQRYTSLPDSSVAIATSDLKAYYEKHKKQWEQTVSRDIEYVIFNVQPSIEDQQAAMSRIEKIKPEFEQAENAQQFMTLNSDVPFDNKYYTRDQLPVQTTGLFDASVKTIAGPYQEGNSLKLAKLVSAENRPDSVKVRQMLITLTERTEQGYLRAVALADSLKTVIQKGANFADLVSRYSADPSTIGKGGEVGWLQEADIRIPDLSNTLFGLKKGEVTSAETPDGILLAQVTERGTEIKKVQVAILQHDITASSKTFQGIYTTASKFAGENNTATKFDGAVVAQNLSKRIATYISDNDRQIPGLTSAREIVRWAYNSEKNQVSDVFTIDNAYVVAVLKEIREKGIAPFEQVQNEITIAVRREKKAEKISADLLAVTKDAQSFSDIALKLNLPVETATGITFSSFSIPSVGIEPKLIAAATVANEGIISKPIDGNGGVFLFVNKQVQNNDSSLDEAKLRLETNYTTRSTINFGNAYASEPLQALRKAANIEDKRAKFY